MQPCNSITYHKVGPADSVIIDMTIRNDLGRGFINILGWDFGLTPTYGTQVILELEFTAMIGDSVVISCAPDDFTLSDQFEDWTVLYNRLDSVQSVPDTFITVSGDADCSGNCDVSDAVFIIEYIFGGGTPPYDLNSGDANADCSVDISDVVYLIAYIFGGGPAPVHGCVVQ